MGANLVALHMMMDRETLKRSAVFLLLSPHTPEGQDALICPSVSMGNRKVGSLLEV